MSKGMGGVWNTADRIGRPSPFGVQWREVIWDPTLNEGRGGERTKTSTEFFDTAEKRDARAAVLRKQRKRGALNTASRGDIEEWQAFKAAVSGTPWQEVVAGWRAYRMQHGIQECTVTVDDAVKLELDRSKKLNEMVPPQMTDDTLRQKVHKLGLFAEQFGHLKIDQLNAPDIEAWIDDFDEVQTEATFNNYRKIVRAMLQPHVAKKLIRDNPVDAVKKRDDSTGEVGKLTVQETAHLFAFAMKSDTYKVAIGRFALEAFVGLRFSSGCRLEKRDINYEDRGIELPKRKIKTRKRHYIDGLPDQVWDWLAITPDECWDLTPRQYMELKSCLFVEAGVPHPHNCFRHGFCSYDIAAHKNPGRTAVILCHRNQDLLWDRYKGRARESDGKLYQTITPKTAKELAKGYVPLAVPGLPVA